MKPKISLDKRMTKLIFIFLILIGGIFFAQQDFSIFKKNQTQNKQTENITKSKNKPQIETNYVLNIEKLQITAPIILNVNGNNKEEYNKALEGGVAHLTGSALPGKTGNIFIFGHSSYYAWKPGNYKKIFATLNQLVAGDKIEISSNLKKYTYQVMEQKIVLSNDVSVTKQDHSEHKLTLMTCWPLNTDYKRLVIVANLSETLNIK